MPKLPRAFAFLTVAVTVTALTLLTPTPASSATPFSNTTLFATAPVPGVTTSPVPHSTGNSEPAIAFGPGGKMAVDGLAWLPYQVNLWEGTFGSAPDYFGAMDTSLPHRGAGRLWLGDGDADLTITDAGTTLLADLDFIFNGARNNAQFGVSVTRCPAGADGPSDCTTSLLDQTNADREWITSVGTTAYVSWLDSGVSTTIHVKKSTDDGRTWHQAVSPVVAHGGLTGTCTFNAEGGPIVADPTTGDVYSIYICGDTTTKGQAFTGNNVIVSRSTDGGKTYRAFRVFHGPRDRQLANIFPSLAVDPGNGTLYATWTDTHDVWVSSSADHAVTWSNPADVSTIRTTVMPWVAALDGKVDVVYYGTTASSVDEESAVWNVYDSQRVGGQWSVLRVSNTPNRVGAVCLEGSGCEGDRELLDLFEVAEDPISGKAAVIYTNSTISTWTENGETHELPEIVLAFER
jgi:hypothetical protein